jgi:hypothetical protein
MEGWKKKKAFDSGAIICQLATLFEISEPMAPMAKETSDKRLKLLYQIQKKLLSGSVNLWSGFFPRYSSNGNVISMSRCSSLGL